MRPPVEAVVVNMRERGPGQMVGMGSELTDFADRLSGGALTSAQQQADRLELFLKISIAASIFSGLAALAMIYKRR